MRTNQTIAMLIMVLGWLSACERESELQNQEEDAAVTTAPALAPSMTRPMGPIPGEFEDIETVENPYLDNPEAPGMGRELFVAYNCYGCHGGYGGGGMAPSLRDENWMYGSSAWQIFSSIAEGRPHGMPAWGVLLPPELIWQLTAYIQTMRTDQEPPMPM